MLSAEDFAAIKIAVELCNSHELKGDILNISRPPDEDRTNFESKSQWDTNIENKSKAILEKLGIINCLQEKVMGHITLIGVRMLIWTEFHENIIGFSRNFSLDFFKGSIFTSKGIINDKGAARELMKCKKLSIQKRYKLACLYCFVDEIHVLFNQISKKNQEKFYDPQDPYKIKHPKLVMYWSYFVMGDVDKITEEQSTDDYLLEIAIESGIRPAVEYALDITEISKMKSMLIDAALKTIENRLKEENYYTMRYCAEEWYSAEDWINFRNCRPRFNHNMETRVPTAYFVNVLCFLLDKMTVPQQVEFLSKDYEVDDDLEEDSTEPMVVRVLGYFLEWPHQAYFMRTANLMWKLLPEINFVNLLSDICSKIEYGSELGTLQNGEGKVYNYRELLNIFWRNSPEDFKRYLFRESADQLHFSGKDITFMLFSSKNFTNEDKRNVEMILESATDNEKREIIFSEDGEEMCFELMTKGKWERLNLFVVSFCSSLDQQKKFKKEFSFSKKAQLICIDFAINEKYAKAESFMRWSDLTAEDIIKLKKEMISSDVGKKVCSELLIKKALVNANAFFTWFISSEEELKKFKKKFIVSRMGDETNCVLILKDMLPKVDEFAHWCFASKEEMTVFKRKFANRRGGMICVELISNRQSYKAMKKVDHWEQVVMFLTWCFSSEDEITNFKRKILLKENATDTLSNLISACKWDDAEIFFSWLALSSEEISYLKKETLLSDMTDIYETVCEKDPEKYLDYVGGKWEKIELLLRWCLTDQVLVLEFKDKYDEEYGYKSYEKDGEEISEDERIELNKFYLLIDEYLQNIENVKKNSGT